ncbi:MAG: YrzE family protein [Acidimicrobiales bacterium]
MTHPHPGPPEDDPIDHHPTDRSIDVRAVARGAAVGAAITLPAAIVQNVVSTDSSLWGLMLAVILLALGWCGWVAAKAAGRRTIVHGALAALSAFVVVQALGVVLRLARGDTVHPVGFVFNGLLSTACGMIGAELGGRRQQRRLTLHHESPDSPDSPDAPAAPDGPGGN